MPHAHRPADNIEPSDVFTRLRVEEFVAMTLKRRRLWRCVCICGNEILVNGTDLVRNETQSCGCLRNDRARENREKHRKDMTNTPLRHGGVVIGPSDQYVVRGNGDRYNLWRCRCACGNEFLAQALHIVHRNRSFCSRKCPFTKKKDAPPESRYAATRAVLSRPNGYKLVAAEEKTKITLAAAQGDQQARELLVMLYERWVWQQARQYAATHRILGELDIEELVQECRLALLKAAERWEPERGAFTTCARWWLLDAMGRESNSGTSGIDVPANAHRNEGTREYAINAHKMLSLDAPVGDNDKRTFKDVLEGATELAEFVPEDLDALPKLLARLPEPQRFAIEQYYLGEKTLEEVGAERGVTRERIRQLVAAGLKTLKKRMAQRDRVRPLSATARAPTERV